MSDERDEHQQPAEQGPGRELQDYLDSLLAPPATPSSPQVEMELPLVSPDDVGLPDNVRRFRGSSERGKPASSASMVSSPAANEPRVDRQREPDTAKPKPFAEAKKPLPFTLPKLAPATTAREQPDTPAPAVEPEAAPVEAEPKAPAADPPPEAPAADAPPPEPAKAPDGPGAPAVAEAPAVDTPAGDDTVEDAPVEPAPAPAAADPDAWLANGRPAWGQEPFECLLFTVGGLTLAVPLVELGTIYPIESDLTPIFGQVDWFMGLLSVKGLTIRTANTAKIVMPERYREEMADGFRFVMSLHGLDWGLAIDNVSKSITLDPDQVKWRGERSKRPWLAGTVIDHMCALMDVSQLTRMFARAGDAHRG